MCVGVCVCENMPNCSYVNNVGKCLCVCVCVYSHCLSVSSEILHLSPGKGISSSSAQLVLIVRECGSSQVPAVVVAVVVVVAILGVVCCLLSEQLAPVCAQQQ